MSIVVLLVEKNIFKKTLTPSVLLMIPFFVALFVNLAFSYSLGYRVVNIKTVLFIIVNIFIFFLIGQVMNFIFTKGNIIKLNYVCIENHTNLYKICLIIALLSIALSSLNLIKFLLASGFSRISSKEFADIYGTGIVAHIRLISYFTFFYFIYDWMVTKRKKSILISIILFGLILIYQVKYQLIWLLLGAIYLLYLEGKINITIKKALIIILGLFGIFSGVYIISIGSRIGFKNVLSHSFFNFLLDHFYFYLTSSIQGLDVLLHNQTLITYDIRYFFMIPFNIWAKLSGQDYVNIIHDWVNISYDRSTNVYTMFGSIYMNLGYMGTLLGTVLISSFSHILYLVSKKSSNIYLKIMNALNMAIITTSFFGFYYNMILVWESFIVLTAMIVLSKMTFTNTKSRVMMSRQV